MPTKCNRGFYCRSYCLLKMFRAPLCPSSGAQEYYTVVAACGISCCDFSSCWSGVELRVMCPVCRMLQQPVNRTYNPHLHTTMPIIRSSKYYTVVVTCCISCCGFQVAGLVWSWGLCVRFVGSSAPHQSSNLKTTARNTTGSNHCIILLSSWWRA